MTQPEPTRSFRNVPPAVYIALAAGIAGAVPVVIATLTASGELVDRYLAAQRWHLLQAGCDAVSTVLLALGLLELAQRHVGRARVLTQVGASLSLAGCGWLVVHFLSGLAAPSLERTQLVSAWVGSGLVVIAFAGAVLVTLGAGAWRRAPVAAAALVIGEGASFGMPGIGAALLDLLGPDPAARYVYSLGRLAVSSAALLLIAATLAAGGREPAPDPAAAARGFRLARGALLFRVVAAVAISAILVAGRSAGAAKLVMFAGPGVVVVTMLAFAIALQRVASARLGGMPPLLLSLGAALTLWWGTVQLQQLSTLLRATRNDVLRDVTTTVTQWFSIAGPLVATLGMALVGCAIVAFARHRGDEGLREAAAARTTILVVTTLSSIGFQLKLPMATSVGGALGIMTLAALLAIVAFVALLGLLARTARSIEADPGLPPARLV